MAFFFKNYSNNGSLASAKSLYAKVFHNNTMSTNADLSFPDDLAKPSSSTANYQDVLIASLNISASDLSLLKCPFILANNNVNFQNLSQLYQHSVLAHDFRVSILNYLIISMLSESILFSSTATLRQ